jgi:hypothetical protein
MFATRQEKVKRRVLKEDLVYLALTLPVHRLINENDVWIECRYLSI